ncbi:hypothetical protein ASG43_02415 [Aureimonas sp. Leaf454]|uniref:hypothetical protein n=1 Tax=Aureimonas sp. Leaf454 TaxID=1736381 RepID=UPI0006FEA88A|nr:hypothetical protein [Aureimonas sp. Leaf454]KQT54471.1 hypothetical protein ASG43_02415 [Aureimonas sp. Leaf454]
MTTRRTITACCDWAAFLGAIAMVGFLTFVPQHASSASTARPEPSQAAAETVWPSQTAALSTQH